MRYTLILLSSISLLLSACGKNNDQNFNNLNQSQSLQQANKLVMGSPESDAPIVLPPNSPPSNPTTPTNPVITNPKPPASTPADPVVTNPEPPTTTPDPVVTNPEPPTTTPDPVVTNPEPPTTIPDPVATNPKPPAQDDDSDHRDDDDSPQDPVAKPDPIVIDDPVATNPKPPAQDDDSDHHDDDDSPQDPIAKPDPIVIDDPVATNPKPPAQDDDSDHHGDDDNLQDPVAKPDPIVIDDPVATNPKPPAQGDDSDHHGDDDNPQDPIAKPDPIVIDDPVATNPKPPAQDDDSEHNGDDGNYETPIVIDDPMENVFSASERFNVKSNKLDILVITDTSLSMRDDLWTIGKRFRPLIKYLNKTDFRIAATSTSISGPNALKGRLVPATRKSLFLTRKNKPKELDELVSFIECNNDLDEWIYPPCTTEKTEPLKTSILAFSNPHNQSFFRQNADLAVIYISDEDEQKIPTNTATQPEEVIQAFKQQFPYKKLTTFGIIIPPGDQECLSQQTNPFSDRGAQYGTFVNQLNKLTGGFSISICSPSLIPLFQKLRKLSGTHNNKRFTLQHRPLSKKDVTITLLPSQNVKWKIEGKTLIFKKSLKPGTQIVIKYKYKK
ncbi:MAG: hypothetical protein D6797_01095 [Bdellovibrio sp.]|nr:MAG: hypothetical protein D6797_01095 [Bdellovibrio sp.]